MKNRVINILKNLLGIISLILIIALVLYIFVFSKSGEKNKTLKKSNSKAQISFDSDEIVYDGVGTLDLMSGVKAQNADGEDITDKINAVIANTGNKNHKVIRYLICDGNGIQNVEKRSLVLKNYSGPSLRITEPLYVNSSDLANLIEALKKREELSAGDGYSNDITNRVHYVREHVSEDEYKISFSVVNDYTDVAEKTVRAYIKGAVKDPEITLVTDKININVGENFDPYKCIASVENGASGNSKGGVEMNTSLDVNKPGRYNVVFTLYNGDKTAKATKILQVTVE